MLLERLLLSLAGERFEPYGIEIDPAYCDVTIRRLHAVCGLDAVLDATGQPFAEIEALRAAAAPTPVEAAPRLEGAT